jgi:hypothetical protein
MGKNRNLGKSKMKPQQAQAPPVKPVAGPPEEVRAEFAAALEEEAQAWEKAMLKELSDKDEPQE